MAQFVWQGVDLSGNIRSGTLLARSVDELSSLLFTDDIALVTWRVKKPLPFIQSVSLVTKAHFFGQLSLLVGSGIFLDQALQLVLHQIKKGFFKELVADMLLDLQHGISFSNALKNYPMVFDALTIQMVETGQESGKLVEALEHLCKHQEMVLEFKKKVRNVLLMPLITFVFFIVLALVIFIYIVPTFSGMFATAGQPLSQNTRYVLSISEYVRSWYTWVVISVSALVAAGIQQYCVRYKKITYALEYALLTIPGIRSLVRDTTFAYFFQSVAIMTKTGVHLITAFTIAHQSIAQTILRKDIGNMLESIDQGHSLVDAARGQKNLFSEQIHALLSVGQESGCLPFIFGQIAMLYKERINRFLTTMATLIQPLLMIILGLLITGLVFSVYAPLFNLSSVVM